MEDSLLNFNQKEITTMKKEKELDCDSMHNTFADLQTVIKTDDSATSVEELIQDFSSTLILDNKILPSTTEKNADSTENNEYPLKTFIKSEKTDPSSPEFLEFTGVKPEQFDLSECDDCDCLVPRGPIGNAYPSIERHRPYASPYRESSTSPPLQDRRKSSGGSVQIYSQQDYEKNFLEDNNNFFKNDNCPKRLQYLRGCGGVMQEIPQTILLSPNSFCYSPSEHSISSSPNPSMSVTSPAPSVASSSDFYSEGDAATPIQLDVQLLPKPAEEDDFATRESFDSSYSSYANTPSLGEDSDVPDDVIELIEDYEGQNGIDKATYKEKIDKILKDMEDGERKKSLSLSPAAGYVNENEEQNDFKSSLVTSMNGIIANNEMVNGNSLPLQQSQQTVTYVIIQQNVRTPRVILPKPVASNKCAETKSEIPEKSPDELKKVIVSNYSQDKRRHIHCTITKWTDEDLDRDVDGDTKLHIAITNKNELASVYLIDRFASSETLNLNMTNHSLATPLLCAVLTNQKLIVEYLLAKGADPNAVCPMSKGTVLHFAAQRGSEFLDIVKLLARNPKTQFDTYDKTGRTPLLLAVEAHGRGGINSCETISFLLQCGASMRQEDRRSGKNAVHIATEMKAVDILEILKRECSYILEVVNKPNFSGNSPLHCAASLSDCTVYEQVQIIRLLLDCGASPKVTNQQHKSPFDLVEKDRREVKRLLQSSRRGSRSTM